MHFIITYEDKKRKISNVHIINALRRNLKEQFNILAESTAVVSQLSAKDEEKKRNNMTFDICTERV